MSRFVALFTALLAVINPLGSVAAENPPTGEKPVTVRMQTNMGTIVLELDSEKAPATVENFVDYAKSGFYDGTVFHRVIPGFMIQGGGFEPGMNQKPTRASIKNEADNGLANDSGTIAMARTSDPNSATSQFFINAKDNDFLNYTSSSPQGWGYCVFGKVVEGMDVVQKIEKVATGSKGMHQDVPTEDVVIEKVTVDE
jgi:peptidyl-prolyl cis-trans isomerase B (cyclophilin B)